MDKKHTVFGKLVGGEDVLDTLEKLPLKDNTERPAKPVRITEIVMWVVLHLSLAPTHSRFWYRYQDPFEDYKNRLAKKLAKRSEADQNGKAVTSGKKDEDDVNWFGVKVGTNSTAFGAGSVGGGVGKYLNLKRPVEGNSAGGTGEDGKKKRKIGFGEFEGW